MPGMCCQPYHTHWRLDLFIKSIEYWNFHCIIVLISLIIFTEKSTTTFRYMNSTGTTFSDGGVYIFFYIKSSIPMKTSPSRVFLPKWLWNTVSLVCTVRYKWIYEQHCTLSSSYASVYRLVLCSWYHFISEIIFYKIAYLSSFLLDKLFDYSKFFQ